MRTGTQGPAAGEHNSAIEHRSFGRAIYEESVRLLFKAYFRLVHSVRIEGIENIPQHFDRLIVVSNHAALIDGVLLWTYLKLPFKIIVDRATARRPFLKPFMQNRFTVQIDSMNPYSLKDVIRRVTEGVPLLVFPEGRMTLTGSVMKIYEGTGFTALKTGAHILPVYIKGSYHSVFSRKRGGRTIFAPISVTIGKVHEPIVLEHLPNRKRKEQAARIIYKMLSEGYVAARNKPSTLGREFILKCRENGPKTLFSDPTGATVTYRKALVGAFALGRYFSSFDGRNVGVMLPNLTVTGIVFMGLQIFRKTPVLLNYSAGPAALQHAMNMADLKVIITSRQFLQKARLTDAILAGRRVVFLEDLKSSIRVADKLRAAIRSVFPGGYAKAAPVDSDEIACILFTSGSEGVPKGVCLSHGNLITNVHQALSRIDANEHDYFLAALPIFHSFGLLVGILIPIFLGARSFLYVSPLHYRIVPQVAYDQQCTILCGTNTFLKGYARRGNAYDFHSMRYIFCGAERLSDAVFDEYAKKFGIRVMSGYGATECAPIISINSALEHQYGTVGTVLPGIECRLGRVEGIDDRDGTVGKLFVQGRNVMKGYLKNEKANHKYLVEDEGWYDTGDIVEITEEGFVKIAGRLKRFAKISGEMISLTAVEEALLARFGERRSLAVLAVPDEQRGERLIVVTNNAEVELKAVRETLRARGFSELASPRDVRFFKDLPKLGNGKVDYVKLSEVVGVA